MIFPCGEEGCNIVFATKPQLQRHNYDNHTSRVTVSIDQTSYFVSKETGSFSCPICDQKLKTTTTFLTHFKRKHDQSAYAESSQRRKDNDRTETSYKLPKIYGESDVKAAKISSREIKTLTRPIAALAAAGAMDVDVDEQQKILILTNLTKLTPITLTADNKQFYLLGNNTTVGELASEQPQITFRIPPELVDTSNEYNVQDNLLAFLINNSSVASILKTQNYIEMNENILMKANADWLQTPQARFAVSQLFAGCILLAGTKAILVNCLEPYGRKKSIDPHYERHIKGNINHSIPNLNDNYKDVCVRLLKSDNSVKLIIGLYTCNLLVTSSCTISDNPVVCVGSSTTSFIPTKSTRIYLHSKAIEESGQLFEDNLCYKLYTYDLLDQCKQVRSKFHRVETYYKCRSSSVYAQGHMFRPYTIWTLYDYDSAQKMDSQAKLGSLLFQRIAQEVFHSVTNNTIPLVKRKIFEQFQGKNGEFVKIIKDILKLFGESDEITIIDNNDLDKHLQSIVGLISPSLRTANEVVAERLLLKFT